MKFKKELKNNYHRYFLEFIYNNKIIRIGFLFKTKNIRRFGLSKCISGAWQLNFFNFKIAQMPICKYEQHKSGFVIYEYER